MRPAVPMSLDEAKRQYGERWAIFTPVEKAAILKGTSAHAAMRRGPPPAPANETFTRPRSAAQPTRQVRRLQKNAELEDPDSEAWFERIGPRVAIVSALAKCNEGTPV